MLSRHKTVCLLLAVVSVFILDCTYQAAETKTTKAPGQKETRPVSRVKLIEISWSNPTVEFLAEHIQDMEKTCPMDGVTVRVNGFNHGKTIPGHEVMSRNFWKYEWFKETIERYKKIPFRKLTDNFYYTVVSPGDADWFCDSDWAAVCNNYAIAARIAKETGMRGLFFDIEEYGQRFWNYSTVSPGKSYKAAYDIARKRGVEWGQSVFAAYPDIVLLAPFTMTYGTKDFSLSVPFFNGILSVMPHGASLHDGHEEQSYRSKKDTDYDWMVRLHYCESLSRIEPVNRMKYKTQVKLSPGFYMDGMFPETRDSTWYQKLQPEIGELPISFFFGNLIRASCVADEFIWIYSEKGAWWNGSQYALWEKRFSGLTEIVRVAKNPDSADVSGYTNLLKNSDFREKQKEWNFWQIEQDQHLPLVGRGFEEDGHLKMEGTNYGSFVQIIPVKPGQSYLVRCTGRYETETAGFCSFSICFKDKAGRWDFFDRSPNMVFPQGRTGEWMTRTLVFTVPENVYSLAVLLNGHCLQSGEKVGFKEVALYRFCSR